MEQSSNIFIEQDEMVSKADKLFNDIENETNLINEGVKKAQELFGQLTILANEINDFIKSIDKTARSLAEDSVGISEVANNQQLLIHQVTKSVDDLNKWHKI
jgi:methyl-accepting chemotaxis protein